MPIPFKDIVDIVSGVVTALGICGAVIGWFITKHDRENAGKKAMEQIDTMATNCFPTMQAKLIEIANKTSEGNKSLSEIATGIAILVDRHKDS
jgi:hypothetical protein